MSNREDGAMGATLFDKYPGPSIALPRMKVAIRYSTSTVWWSTTCERRRCSRTWSGVP